MSKKKSKKHKQKVSPESIILLLTAIIQLITAMYNYFK